MNWQLAVIAWLQFALSAAIVLGVAWLVMPRIAQPAERGRWIMLTLVAALAAPLVAALSPWPAWKLEIAPADVTPVAVLTGPSATADPHAAEPDQAAGQESQPAVESPRNAAPSPALAKADNGEIAPDRGAPSDRAATHDMESSASPATSPAVAPSRPAWLNGWFALGVAIFLAHAAAAVLFLAEHVAASLRLRSLVSSARAANDATSELWARIAGADGRNVQLLVSDRLHVPLVFGWRRPVILLPRELAVSNDAALAACLAHEWSHIERGDVPAWKLANLCRFLFWYQPAYWSLRRELRMCQEFLADRRSAADEHAKVEYSELLLTLARSHAAPRVAGALTMFDRRSQVGRRIRMLLENPKQLVAHCSRRFTCAAALSAVVLVVAAGALRLESTQAQDSAQQQTPPATAPSPAPPAEAKEEGRAAPTMITYQQEIAIQGRAPIQVKYFVAPDGRKRSEQGANGKRSITVLGSDDLVRLSLIEASKTAMVYNPSPRTLAVEARQSGHRRPSFVDSLNRLKALRSRPDKELGQREIDGKAASGYVVTQASVAYTIWIDDATDRIVRQEYDTGINGDPAHIVLSDFRYDEPLDESLFSTAVPVGYRVHQPPEERQATPDEDLFPDSSRTLELVWSRPGQWVAVDTAAGSPNLFALDGSGTINRLAQFDPQGQQLSINKIDDRARDLLTARLTTGDTANSLPQFLTYGSSMPTIKAHTATGKLLWYDAEGSSVSDVCAADLNGDGIDEVIASFNALRVLDHEGHELWKNPNFGNSSQVAAGNMQGDEKLEVLIASSGKIFVFDAAGKRLRDFQPPIYPHLISTWSVWGNPKVFCPIVLAGSSGSELVPKIALVDADGTPRWSISMSDRVINLAVCREQPWLAVTMANGLVRVLDLTSGAFVAEVTKQGSRADLAWLSVPNGSPLLVVASGDVGGGELRAFRVPAPKP